MYFRHTVVFWILARVSENTYLKMAQVLHLVREMAKFELDLLEQNAFNRWNREHLSLKHNGKEPYTGAMGGRVSFRIMPTDMGEILTSECAVCRAKGEPYKVHTVCLTDFSEW